MKALKIIGILIVLVFAAVLYAPHWMKQVNEDKWHKFSELKHCKQITGDQYQCDSGSVTKRSGSVD